MPNNHFLFTVEPLVFTFCFTIEGYNVLEGIMMAKSIVNPSDQDTQGLPELNTFLNLFNS